MSMRSATRRKNGLAVVGLGVRVPPSAPLEMPIWKFAPCQSLRI